MYRRVLVMLVCATFLAAACGSDGGDTGGTGGTGGGGSTDAIVIAIDPPLFIDPHLSQDHRIHNNIFERLLDRDRDDPEVLVPRLASELPTPVDETTWEVKLRQGVSFTNGEPFDATAVVASIERIIDPALDSDIAGELQTISGASAVDESTVHITTTGPDPILPSRLFMIFMVPPEYAQDDDFAENPVGTGPYQFVEYVPGQHLSITRNDDYWGPAPPIKDATFRFITDNVAKVSALRAGEIDLAYNLLSESANEVPQFIRNEGIDNGYLRLKTYEGPFADQRVREAAARALNIEQYIATLYNGNATLARCQPMGETVFGFNPDLEAYPYDPDGAADLLDEAGYAGEAIRIIAPTDRWPIVGEMMEAIASDLEAVGFTVDLVLSLRAVWGEELFVGIGEGQPDIAFSATSTELNDADKLTSLVGEKGVLSSDPDPVIDGLLDEARVTLDADARQALYEEATEHICTEVSLISLFTFNELWGASQRLQWEPRIDAGARVEEMTLAG